MAGNNNGSGSGGKLPGWVLHSTSFLSMQYRIPTIALDEFEVDAQIIALVPKELCEKRRVLPVSRAASSLIVAMVDPVDELAIGALASHTGLKNEPVITSDARLVEAILKYDS